MEMVCMILSLIFQLVEFADNGNIVDGLNKLTIKKFCQIMPQILDVLQFIASKGYIHCRISEFAVFMFSPTQVCCNCYINSKNNDIAPQH